MPQSLDVQLHNDSNSSQVYAYVTGISLQERNGQRVLLKANGQDLYFPENPPAIMSPLAEDCAIPLGPPGSTKTIHIPQMAGGRIWFSREGKLTFMLNPGPALVEPSVLNPTDPNADVDFAFAEFTLNNDQLFANISYVDFVPRLPVALTLQTADGAVQHVSGMPADGLDKVCEGLRAQAAKDHRPWDKLVVQKPGQPPLRALNPTHGNAVGASFDGYYEPFIEEVWSKYHEKKGRALLKVNTQAGPGIVSGVVTAKDELVIGGEPFRKPTTADILGCNSGPFTTGPSATRNAIIPRLAAGFLRTAIADIEHQPSDPSTFYRKDPTNHYARIVHEVNLDGKGYAFAYDDVQPDGGKDQSGKVNAGDPKVWIVSVGGNKAYAGDRLP
ncbi:glycoside hydrolase family 64 protein [Coniochaeta ligniaria NRRL 30616]|uniref:Glycoside hydrolase family 64 protein n=1 Tax=Coniochaeta ligniaria NRRL 30616 TaxID=1408157 RepID=A0A1J7J8I9_9PEZI|nr:glycoside hydrolase family 64 protein [Coniochaeta ligniaria NRRL 30616]